MSADTRTRVQQAARELGDVPNRAAQRLKKQRTETIGFIMPTYGPRFSDPFFSELITIFQPIYQIARQVARMLIQII